ncbi:MAG: radical SAM protein [Acutalibacteraceae bacterium]|nr:radical SAM protein [Acutalibacteraceae bacterium]
MKVVICQINSKYIHSSLAAWCLRAGVKAYCKTAPSVSVVEGTINEAPDTVIERLTEKHPDIIGFCCYIWNITYLKALAKRVKELLPECRMVFGGPEVSYNAESVLLECDFLDYVICGEGEYPFAYLADCIQKGKEPENCGICYKKEGSAIISEPYISADEPPSPYCDEYFDTLGGRMVYFETSRGCPYRCAFCLSGRCGGVRYFDINRIKSEILMLAASKTQTIKFVDRTFNANKRRAKEIIRFVIQHYGNQIPENLCFHFEIAGDILDQELLKLLSGAPKGLFQLEIGMQSFNAETLSHINRKTDCELLKRNIIMLTQARNMHIHIDLIAGLPMENLESFKESFNTAYSLKANMLQLGFLKLLHGADMREDSEKFPCTFSEFPPYEVIDTPHISKEEILLLKKIEDVVERTYNSGRFTETLNYLEGLGFTPFDVFAKISEGLGEGHRLSLDEYGRQLFAVLSTFEGVDSARLRDIMLCDRMRSVADGKIPDFLRIEDEFLKTAKHFLEKTKSYKRPEGIKRAVALLYSERSVVWCDYDLPDRVTGHYTLNKLPFDKIVKYCD